MRILATLAALALAVTLIGCASTQDASTTSAGAVGECGPDCSKACCVAKTDEVSPGAVGKCGADCVKACCATQCPFSSDKQQADTDGVSPGAVGNDNSNLKQCPFSSGAKQSDVSPGVVGKSGCCKSKFVVLIVKTNGKRFNRSISDICHHGCQDTRIHSTAKIGPI